MNWKEIVHLTFERSGHALEDDVLEELAQHAASAYAQARANGQSREHAEQRVRAQIDEWIQNAAGLRHRRRRTAVAEPPTAAGGRWPGVVADVRYALRLLRRRPAPTALTVATMALGIGATTALFSVVSGVLWTPLPWPGSDRLVRIVESREGSPDRGRRFMTNGPYLAWREAPATIEAIGAYAAQVATLTGNGEPRRVRIAAASASLFKVLQVQPALGALFDARNEPSADQIVLSHAFWQGHFGSAREALGAVVTLDGRAYTIVGVMPRTFAFPDRETQAWIPYHVRPVIGDDPATRSISMFSGIARLRPGVTASQASAEGTARGRQAPDAGMAGVAVFGSRSPVEIRAIPMLVSITEEVRSALVILLIAVALLLATATANVAGVQLARATTRSRELAIRAAIGAGSQRLVQQLILENLITGLLGGVAGLLLALWLHWALPGILPADFPRAREIVFDYRVVSFALALSVVTGIVFGLAPAFQLRRLNLLSSLTEHGPVAAGGRRSRPSRARAYVIAGQVAAATVLLIGASLLMRSFTALLSADRGYSVTNVLSARMAMPAPTFSGTRRAEIGRNVLERLRTIPGVTEAALTTVLPLSGADEMFAFTLPSAGPTGESTSVHAALRTVSAGYFQAMGIRLADGRLFTDRDGPTSMGVVVVNRTFARNYFEGTAVGRTIPTHFDAARNEPWHIIGVVEDVLRRSPGEPPQPEVYVHYRQRSEGIPIDPMLVVRTAADPAALAERVQRIVREEDPALALESVMTMEDRLLDNLARPRLYAVVFAGFAVATLVIAGVGLFGVLSYTVAQRSREIGVRAALGARPSDIARLVVFDTAVITAAGLSFGLVAALALGPLLSAVLFGVTPHDPVSFAIVPVILVLGALVASYMPARRAAALDPLQVLREG